MDALAQVLGIVLLICAGVIGLTVSSPRFGATIDLLRDTLAALSTYTLMFAVTRSLVWGSVITREESLILNTLMTGAFVAIGINLVALHVLWVRVTKTVEEVA